MKRVQTLNLAFIMLCILNICAGCGNKFFDPTQIGRFRPTPAVNVILDSLGVAEETPVAWDEAEDPKPNDIVAVESDYVFQAGDVIRISIFELLQEGVPVINSYVVTETGKISIPDVGIVQAAGLTETQLEEEIRQILSPSILKEPSVSVALMSSQQRTFSIIGEGVPGPSRYMIPRYDFRLTDALATAGGIRQFNVSYIYVSRQEKGGSQASEVSKTRANRRFTDLDLVGPKVSTQVASAFQTREQELPNTSSNEWGPIRLEDLNRSAQLEREMLELISPTVQHRWPESEKVVSTPTDSKNDNELAQVVVPGSFQLLSGRKQSRAEPQHMLGSATELAPPDEIDERTNEQDVDGHVEWIYQDGKWVPVQVEPLEQMESLTAENENSEGIEWIFQDGKWIPVRSGQPAPGRPPIKFETDESVMPLESEKLPAEIAWEAAVQTRLIKIPADKLLAGDPRYNIVIKAGDTIHVPVDVIGEFCIMGNVNRSGYINITGRPMTLKMAIAAAGGLGMLAWPKNCEVVRRIGEDKEEIVMVDLDKIASGEQPDFFIKPNDLINVGTHPTSRWRAILRNSFRATYGFGFVYDRNFAYRDYYGTTYNPIAPWKWGGVF